jgi:hypothetical protein
MSFIHEVDPDVWITAAAVADTDGILDMADQLAVVRDHDPARAQAIGIELGAIVTERLAGGSLHPEVVNKYFQTASGYTTS